MLIELALRGRLQLEACGMRRKSLLTRKVRGGLCNIAFLKSLSCLKMKNVSTNSFLLYWSIVDLHCANSCYIIFSYMYTYILFFFFFLISSWVLLRTLLKTVAQETASWIGLRSCTLFFIFFSIVAYRRILNKFAVLYSRTMLFY